MQKLFHAWAVAAVWLVAAGPASLAVEPPTASPIGPQGHVGCLENPKQVDRLQIDEPGVYENYLVDGNWQGGNRVKISADNVTLRHCEIRNCTGNGVGVFGTRVVIENCRIHHLLSSTFDEQHDAHGVTGRWGDVTIRDCEIYYTSGDSVQFDPDRKSSGSVTIENCNLWTGPLPEDAAGFRAGQRPGENAFDAKTPADTPRCRLIVRNCILHGWNQPGQIGNLAALNLKENIHATVEHCVFYDNEIGLRVRGPGSRGGALVEVRECAIYDSLTGVRIEDAAENLSITRLGFGDGVGRRYHITGDDPPGYENTGEHDAPPIEQLLREGF